MPSNSAAKDIDRIDRAVGGITARVGDLEKSHAALQVSMSYLQTSVNTLDTKVSNLAAGVVEMRGDMKDLLREVQSKPDARKWIRKNWHNFPAAMLIFFAAIYGAKVIYNTTAFKDASRVVVK